MLILLGSEFRRLGCDICRLALPSLVIFLVADYFLLADSAIQFCTLSQLSLLGKSPIGWFRTAISGFVVI